MSYKTILVHVDRSHHASPRIELAARLAAAEQAHLVGVAPTGISRYVHQLRHIYEGSTTVAPFEGQLGTLRERARQMLANFEAVARRVGVDSFESRAIDDEAGAGLSLQARYADLVVIGQADRDDPAAAMADLPEFVVMNCGRPVLLVPTAGPLTHVGERILIAWDAGVGATRAVTAALPLLRRARNVDVVVFNGEASDDGHGAEPGADIALYLARHRVTVNVVQQNAGVDVGSALLSLAADRGADMLVMGCYGHSRFRETLLGGVSRTVLERMNVPLLMAH